VIKPDQKVQLSARNKQQQPGKSFDGNDGVARKNDVRTKSLGLGAVLVKSLFAAFKTLKDVMSGDVVAETNTLANGGLTTMSLRLKRNSKSGEYYVVLAELSSGNSQYVSFTCDEFGQFSEAVNSTQTALQQHSEGPKT